MYKAEVIYAHNAKFDLVIIDREIYKIKEKNEQLYV